MTYDADQLRPMLIERNGNVAAIAKEIGADSEDLRNFVMNTPILRRALDEVIARGVDQSMSVLFAGLDDEHYGNRLAASKIFMHSRAAARRGFNHHAGDIEVKVAKTGGALTLTWLPPDAPEMPLIEGKVIDDE